MYRSVLLDKNTSKMFTFGTNDRQVKTKDSLNEQAERQLLKKGSLLIDSKLQKRTVDP